jgi:hypothetical protein
MKAFVRDIRIIEPGASFTSAIGRELAIHL